MNENIDLTKILKDCPKGFSLYSTIYGNVTFLKITNNVIQFTYSYSTSYGTFTCAAYVSSNGNPNRYFNGECTLFPSKEQRDWSKFAAPWYKKEKFDPNTLKTFDRVLTRHFEGEKWDINFYSYKDPNWPFPYICTDEAYKYCIPYNDETKHLVGTTDDAPECYKHWED